jgi:hypothetical protein
LPKDLSNSDKFKDKRITEDDKERLWNEAGMTWYLPQQTRKPRQTPVMNLKPPEIGGVLPTTMASRVIMALHSF